MKEHSIPPELVINLDETGLPLVTVSQWTLEEEGAVTGLEDKRQITGLLACTVGGEMLPTQLLYEGTTERCYPVKLKFPPGWDVWHSSTHWSMHAIISCYVLKFFV